MSPDQGSGIDRQGWVPYSRKNTKARDSMILPGSADALLQRGFSRRQLGRIATLLAAGSSLPFYNEFAMAQQAERRQGAGRGRMIDPDAVRINQNENPMGPCQEGLEAIARVAPHGWRYSPSNE